MLQPRHTTWWFALLLLSPASLLAQNAPPDFDVFFAKFKTAVAGKDQTTLTALMARHFDFIRAQNVPPAKVFSGLAANNGLQWTNLQQAVQGEPGPYPGKDSDSTSRVLQCTPTQPIYSCFVVFQQDGQNRWRWKGMIMPTR